MTPVATKKTTAESRDLAEARWFQELFGVDLRSLALFRSSLGAMVCFEFCCALRHVSAFYTDAGILPRNVAKAFALDGQWSLHLLSGDTAWQVVLLVTGLLAALAYTVGLRPRASGTLAWLLLVSLHVRNPFTLSGGDILLRAMLFWSLFLPLADRLSVDRWRGRVRGQTAERTVSIASLAPLLQLAALYLFTGLLKTGPEWHEQASAVRIGLESFGTPLGVTLAGMDWLTAGLTRATLWLEFVGPALLFFPLWRGPVRLAAVLCFMTFHVGLALTMELGSFPFICIAAWTIALPSWLWERLERTGSWMSRLGARDESEPPPPRPLARSVHWGLVVALTLVFAWNLGTLIRTRDHVPRPAQLAVRAMGLDQAWRMFAPSPVRFDSWLVFAGERPDGTQVDAYRGGVPLSWDKPPRIAAHYGWVSWRQAVYNLTGQSSPPPLEPGAVTTPLARYFCAPERTHGALRRVDIYRMPPRDDEATPRPVASAECIPLP